MIKLSESQDPDYDFVQSLLVIDRAKKIWLYNIEGENIDFKNLDYVPGFKLEMANSFGVTSDGSMMFVGTSNGCLAEFNLQSPNIELTKNYYQVHEGAICKIKVSNDNQFFFTADDFGNLTKWSIAEQREVGYLDRISDGRITHIIISNDGLYLCTVDVENRLKQFDINDFTLLKDYGMIGDSNDGQEPIYFADISPDSKWMVVYNKFKQI